MKSDVSHIAFIMDGNGRWASERRLPRSDGHREGINAMMRISEACLEIAPYVSFYAFSTENKFRPSGEVRGLLSLMEEKLTEVGDRLGEINIKLNILGDPSYFGDKLRKMIASVQTKTAGNTGGVVNVALNYGGRDELARAAKLYMENGGKKPLEKFLYTAGQPDPDILIRTGGEKRLSNFMLYQLAYTELFFSDTYWPDFTIEELNAVVQEYYKRNRRFGK